MSKSDNYAGDGPIDFATFAGGALNNGRKSNKSGQSPIVFSSEAKTAEGIAGVSTVPVSSTKKKPKPKQKPTQARRVNRKIRTALKSDHPSDVYMAMCREVADKMAETASGRDYAALSKTLLDAYVKYTEALTREQEQADQKQREADKVKSPSPLMSARERHLRVVNE